MESATIFRSLNGSLQSLQPRKYFLEKPASSGCLLFKVPVECPRLICSQRSQNRSLVSYVNASKTTSTLTSDVDSMKSVKSTPEGLVQQKSLQKSTFPNCFQTLLLDVCDETDVAEVKVKVGDFEMHIKRNIGTVKVPGPVAPATTAPATPPPASSKPNAESGPSQITTPPKSMTTVNPFANVSAKTIKLAALEASGSNSYVLVSSPTVGLFRSGRTVKGKKQPPSCKEGDMIKEGQIVGFLDQFGSELPVRSDKAGEVLKVLFKDGEPLGYGDPLVALLPSFPGIK